MKTIKQYKYRKFPQNIANGHNILLLPLVKGLLLMLICVIPSWVVFAGFVALALTASKIKLYRTTGVLDINNFRTCSLFLFVV